MTEFVSGSTRKVHEHKLPSDAGTSTAHFLAAMRDFFSEYPVPPPPPCSSTSSSSSSQGPTRWRPKPPPRTWIMFYSGSSERLTGNWVVAPDRAVSLRDIVECWLQVHPSTPTTSDDKEELEDEQPQCSLLIVSDCPFSGKWTAFADLKDDGPLAIAVQASCGATQFAHEGPEGGLFTQAFVRNAYDSLTSRYDHERWIVFAWQQPASEKLDRMRELFREVALSGEQLPSYGTCGFTVHAEVAVHLESFIRGDERGTIATRIGIGTGSWGDNYRWRVSLRPDVPSEFEGENLACVIL